MGDVVKRETVRWANNMRKPNGTVTRVSIRLLTLASCPFSIPSAPRGTREECNDDRRAETPERMGCGMEKRRAWR